MTIYAILFLAGTLTILLPCILPLVSLVLGVSLAGQRRIRPLVIVAGWQAVLAADDSCTHLKLACQPASADVPTNPVGAAASRFRDTNV